MKKRLWGFIPSLLAILCLNACSGKATTMAEDYGAAMPMETNALVSADSQQEYSEDKEADSSL